ncbi:MAG: hypothetical protein ACTTJS_08275 [Wolinella sp.]
MQIEAQENLNNSATFDLKAKKAKEAHESILRPLAEQKARDDLAHNEKIRPFEIAEKRAKARGEELSNATKAFVLNEAEEKRDANIHASRFLMAGG